MAIIKYRKAIEHPFNRYQNFLVPSWVPRNCIQSCIFAVHCGQDGMEADLCLWNFWWKSANLSLNTYSARGQHHINGILELVTGISQQQWGVKLLHWMWWSMALLSLCNQFPELIITMVLILGWKTCEICKNRSPLWKVHGYYFNVGCSNPWTYCQLFSGKIFAASLFKRMTLNMFSPFRKMYVLF